MPKLKPRPVQFHLDATRSGKVDLTVAEETYTLDLPKEQLLQLRAFIDMLLERQAAPRKKPVAPSGDEGDEDDSSHSR